MSNSFNEITVDYLDLLEALFRIEPKESKTILINFDLNDVKQLFNVFAHIFTNGYKELQKKRGIRTGKINFENLDDEIIGLMHRYFNSFGVDFNYVLYLNRDIEVMNKNDISRLYTDLREIQVEQNVGIDMNRLLPYYYCDGKNVSDYNLVIRGERSTFCLWFNFI